MALPLVDRRSSRGREQEDQPGQEREKDAKGKRNSLTGPLPSNCAPLRYICCGALHGTRLSGQSMVFKRALEVETTSARRTPILHVLAVWRRRRFAEMTAFPEVPFALCQHSARTITVLR